MPVLMPSIGMRPGKEFGYDTDIHVPLIIRGPGIAAGRVTETLTTHTDIAPTIMQLVGRKLDEHSFDGTPIPLTYEDTMPQKTFHRYESINVEYWGMAIPEGNLGAYGDAGNDKGLHNAYRNNTYKALRLIGDGYSLYYAVWCSGEREFYDVVVSPNSHTKIFAS
jgi:N-acetylglucosamine-6-sulfatase